MEQITQSSADSAEETASAAEELSAQSDRLVCVVERLTAMVSGPEVSSGHGHRIGARAGVASGKVTSRTMDESASGIKALGMARSQRTKYVEPGAPVSAARCANKEAFPQEEPL